MGVGIMGKRDQGIYNDVSGLRDGEETVRHFESVGGNEEEYARVFSGGGI